jgi:hypothetical protein
MMSEMIAGPLSTMLSLRTQVGRTLVLGRNASSKGTAGNFCRNVSQRVDVERVRELNLLVLDMVDYFLGSGGLGVLYRHILGIVG